MATLVGRERQSHRKCGAGLRRAVDFDRTVVVFDDLFRDVETETSPALALLGRKIRIEYFVHVRGRNAGSVVIDSNIDIEISLRAGDRDLSFLFRGGLYGIDHDILNGALNLHGIAEKHAWALADVRLQFDVALRRHRLHRFDDFANDG